MTTLEFIDYIDQATRLKGFVIDNYEKSLLLTLAQEQIIDDLYSNTSSTTFEETERRRRMLGNLVYTFEAFKNPEERPEREYWYKQGEDQEGHTVWGVINYKTATGVNDKVVQSYSFDKNHAEEEALVEQPITKGLNAFHKIKSDSVTVTLPEKLMYIIYEQVTFDDLDLECMDGNTAVVVPITHDEYYRAMQNPFRRPNERRVFRLDVAHPRNVMEAHSRILRLWHLYNENDNHSTPYYIKNESIMKDGTVIGDINPYALRDDDRPQLIELISKYKIGKYLCRYIKRPNPIIVDELPDQLTVYGFSHRMESEVNPVLHKIIAQNAVEMAIKNRGK